MKQFTDEQMQELSVFERQLKMARQANCYSGLSVGGINRIAEIWDPKEKVQANCGICVMRLLKRVAESYFAIKEAAQRVKEEVAEVKAMKNVKVETSEKASDAPKAAKARKAAPRAKKAAKPAEND